MWLILVYVHVVILVFVYVDGPLCCWTMCEIKKRVVFCDLGLVCFNVLVDLSCLMCKSSWCMDVWLMLVYGRLVDVGVCTCG